MSNIKFTQLSTCEFKLDSVTDFCLNSQGNRMVLIGNSTDIIIMELMYCCDNTILMPYNNKQVLISQEKPINSIIKHINLVQIYETGNVQESQELALDPIYTSECSTDPLKARVLQAAILPKEHINLCCILTTYGMCEIFHKTAITGEWKPLPTNLTNILFTDVFPVQTTTSQIKTFGDLKNFVHRYLITCFAFSLNSSDIIIFLGTAAGYIIGLKYNESSQHFKEHCLLKTSLNRLSYITIYNNVMLVGCDQGQVRLMKINHKESCLYELDYLWSRKDRMACRKACITYCKNLNSYIVIFCKAAHIMSYRLDLDGAILSSSSLFVSGIKVSGLEIVSENEFIITTIMGTVKHIKILCPTKEELNIEEHVVDQEFDSANLQILGVAASKSKHLWSFLLYRNKEYVHQSKYSSSTAFLNVCKLSSQNTSINLTDFTSRNMNITQDLVMVINLDIFNNIEMDAYTNYLDLETLSFPEHFNDEFLQKLQLKLIIIRKLASYQRMKYRKMKTKTGLELQFLETCMQLLYILGRLQYLQNINIPDFKFSAFQEISIVCMQQQFANLLSNLIIMNNSEDENNLRKILDNFLVLIMDEFEKNKFDTDNFTNKTEYCSVCNEAITKFEKCEQEHVIKRCSISYTQLLLFETQYCPHCYALARNDDAAKLEELFPNNECIKCIYCRFLLKQDVF